MKYVLLRFSCIFVGNSKEVNARPTRCEKEIKTATRMSSWWLAISVRFSLLWLNAIPVINVCHLFSCNITKKKTIMQNLTVSILLLLSILVSTINEAEALVSIVLSAKGFGSILAKNFHQPEPNGQGNVKNSLNNPSFLSILRLIVER